MLSILIKYLMIIGMAANRIFWNWHNYICKKFKTPQFTSNNLIILIIIDFQLY